MLQNASSRRDKNAPIYPTEDDLRGFEQRGDVRGFREEHRKIAETFGSQHPYTTGAAARLKKRLEVLSNLAVDKAREEYFQAVDELRALGRSTKKLAKPSYARLESHNGKEAEKIGALFQEEHNDERRLEVMDMLLSYLRHLPCALPEQAANTPRLTPHDESPERKTHPMEGIRASELVCRDESPERKRPDGESVCLLACGETFSTNSNLTRHTKLVHVKNGTFDKPFACPECENQQRKECVVSSPPEWARHVEMEHGRQHAPRLYSNKTYKAKASNKTYKTKASNKPMRGNPVGCYFCTREYVPGKGFSAHLNKEHRSRGIFEQPFLCPECLKQGASQNTTINGYLEWISHALEAHGRNGQTGAESTTVPSKTLPGKGKRKQSDRESIDESDGDNSARIILDPALVKLESDMETSRSITVPARKKHKFSSAERQDDPGLAKMRNSAYPSSEAIDFAEISMLDTETPRWTSSTNSFSLYSSGDDNLQSRDPSSATQMTSLPDSPMPLSPPHCDIQFEALTQEGEALYRSSNADLVVSKGLETCDGEINRANRNQHRSVSTDKPIVDLTSDGISYTDPTGANHGIKSSSDSAGDEFPTLPTERTKDVSYVFSTPSDVIPDGGMLGALELQADGLSAGQMDGMGETRSFSREGSSGQARMPVTIDGDDHVSREGSSEQPRLPTAIDDDEDVWEVEALLAKWTRGRQTFYLVKWKGYPDEDNSWVGRHDISDGLVDEFDNMYSKLGGNHLGVELLRKRIRRGRPEFFVRWKGRPESENGWQRESTISRERIREYEAGRKESC